MLGGHLLVCTSKAMALERLSEAHMVMARVVARLVDNAKARAWNWLQRVDGCKCCLAVTHVAIG